MVLAKPRLRSSRRSSHGTLTANPFRRTLKRRETTASGICERRVAIARCWAASMPARYEREKALEAVRLPLGPKPGEWARRRCRRERRVLQRHDDAGARARVPSRNDRRALPTLRER